MVGKFLNSWPLGRRPPYFDRWALWAAARTSTRVQRQRHRQTVDGYSTSLVGKFATAFLGGFEKERRGALASLRGTALASLPVGGLPAIDLARSEGWPGNPAVFESDRSDKPPYVRSRAFSFAAGKAFARASFAC